MVKEVILPGSCNGGFCSRAATLSLMSALLVSLLGCAAHVSFVSAATTHSAAYSETGEVLTKTYLSDPFKLGPGEVHEQFHPVTDMPEGHVALRSVTAEIVDEHGASVPLDEVYLHHWIVGQMFVDVKPTGVEAGERGVDDTDSELEKNSLSLEVETAVSEGQLAAHRVGRIGARTCDVSSVGVFFGVGSETRKTVYDFPAPYGVEIGNPDKVPAGKQAKWISQIHAIDTRGAVDTKACIECRCSAYNSTQDERGNPLPEGYIGGLRCCYGGRKCQVAESYEGETRTLYAKYTVRWVPMDPCVVPVRIYDLDVTECQIEYNVDSCHQEGSLANCVESRHRSMRFPDGGRLVFAAGHQHVGGLGITFKGEDGRVLCDSRPIYGQGDTAGDEAGYVTGMGSCVGGGHVIKPNETVSVTSTYSRLGGGHTGVMGLYYMAVAVEEDYRPPPRGLCLGPDKARLATNDATLGAEQGNEEVWRVSMWGAASGFLIGIALTGGIVGLVLLMLRQQQDGHSYSALTSA